MRFHTAVNKFCWQAVMGQPITVWKTAMDQKRPYLGVSDADRAIKFILDKGLFDREIYNVVSKNHTVRDIVDAIRGNIENVNVELVDSQIMNRLSYDVKSEKIGLKGFKPTDSLPEGVSDTIVLLDSLIVK